MVFLTFITSATALCPAWLLMYCIKKIIDMVLKSLISPAFSELIRMQLKWHDDLMLADWIVWLLIVFR